jgi:hypothetical protein
MSRRSPRPNRGPRSVFPPYLNDAIEHLERLADVLETLDPRLARRAASTWLIGRLAEGECLLGALVRDWRDGTLTEAEAARSLNGYLNEIHRGLAVNFGELAPACCVNSLMATATPASYLSVTTSLENVVRPAGFALTSTWAEVDERELVESSGAGSSA